MTDTKDTKDTLDWLEDWVNEVRVVKYAEARTARRLVHGDDAEPRLRNRKYERSAVQVLRLYRKLLKEPMTIAQIMDTLKVSRRSAYNYLSSIQLAGATLARVDDGSGPGEWIVVS